MAKWGTRRVVLQPAVYRNMQRGINQIVNAVRPTLGPLPRVVAVEPTTSAKMPELLDSGGVAAQALVGSLQFGVLPSLPLGQDTDEDSS